MQESYGEGLAVHTGPESCAAVREALTGVRAGRVYSRESISLRDADAVEEGGRPHPGRRQRKTLRSPARSETPCMLGNTSRENREGLWSPRADGVRGRIGKSKDTRR
jgi:hypothetical protein